MIWLKLLCAQVLTVILVCATSELLLASILIRIDKPTQTMTVSVDGQERYRWRVSTGATEFSTPVGSYNALHMKVIHYSREWDNARMPHSIFFTERGHAIHGSNHSGLGTPRSHGCVRLSLPNAAMLYQLVETHGISKTKVVVTGSDPPGNFAPSQPPRQRGTWSEQRSLFDLWNR